MSDSPYVDDPEWAEVARDLIRAMLPGLGVLICYGSDSKPLRHSLNMMGAFLFPALIQHCPEVDPHRAMHGIFYAIERIISEDILAEPMRDGEEIVTAPAEENCLPEGERAKHQVVYTAQFEFMDRAAHGDRQGCHNVIAAVLGGENGIRQA